VRGTVKHNGEISEMFDTAWRVHTDCILALIKSTENKRGPIGRVAYIAGKKLGSAPVRNRIKRRMREASSIMGAPWSGYDVVFVAKSTMAHADFDMISHDMEQIRNAVNSKNERTTL